MAGKGTRGDDAMTFEGEKVVMKRIRKLVYCCCNHLFRATASAIVNNNVVPTVVL